MTNYHVERFGRGRRPEGRPPGCGRKVVRPAGWRLKGM